MEKELWSKARALAEELHRKEGIPPDEHEAKDETMCEDDVSDG